MYTGLSGLSRGVSETQGTSRLEETLLVAPARQVAYRLLSCSHLAEVPWNSRRIFTVVYDTPLVHYERPDRIAGCGDHVLPPIQRVRLRRIRNVSDARVPQRLADSRIVRDQVPCAIAGK